MKHPARNLARYCDGQLPETEAQAVRNHLASCEMCARACDQNRFAGSLLRQLPLRNAPDTIAASLDSHHRAAIRPRQRRVVPAWQVAAAAVALLAVAIAPLYFGAPSQSDGPWTIMRSEDAANSVVRKAVGDTVEAAGASPTRILVGNIGTVDVEPGSRVTLGEASSSTYQLSLERV
jgi:anti-sigma factor RsiW